ncbi:hypothetical protein QYE76_000011 [Lolium multiflorum]|uniref:Uncharacterized protein n=1 Tax=Lolium multiflorum TaxID=4521 RepID=A0AAD8UWS1_LOLMU|nr:hypothetical protein QYE76_000011 [Lolium multiflorum]
MKERRTKAARDPARPSDPAAPAGGASTEAVMREDETHESRRPPLSTLSFTELHTSLSEVHVAEVKRLTALVEEAAKKNRRLIAIGRKGACRGSRGVCEGVLLQGGRLPSPASRGSEEEGEAEVADLTKVLEDKGKELEDVIADYKVRLDAAAEARDAARGAAASLREELAALKLQYAKELAAEKEASEGTLLAVQAEKTGFEAFVREMSRQLLGQCDFVESATLGSVSRGDERASLLRREILAALRT